MKILVIEDNADLREVIVRSLEKERYVVETAPDYSTRGPRFSYMSTTASCSTSCCPTATG